MDSIVNSLAGLLGVNPSTLILLLGVLVAVCNVVGKQIPDDATGTLGIVRKICKVIGLYVPSKITDGVTVNDTARVVAGTATKSSLGLSDSNTTVSSPPLVGAAAILLGVATLFLGGCTTAQTQKVETTVSVLCTSLPLAQTAYAIAMQNHDNATVDSIVSTIRLSCPVVLESLHVYQQTQTPEPAPIQPPLPPITPERG